MCMISVAVILICVLLTCGAAVCVCVFLSVYFFLCGVCLVQNQSYSIRLFVMAYGDLYDFLRYRINRTVSDCLSFSFCTSVTFCFYVARQNERLPYGIGSSLLPLLALAVLSPFHLLGTLPVQLAKTS